MQTGVAFNLLAAGFNQGSTLVVNLVVANLLGREAFGKYTMVLTTLATLATLGQLSMGYTATKHVAEYRAVDPGRTSRILGLGAMVSFLSALAAALALALSAGWLARAGLETPDLAPLLRLTAAAVFFTVLTGFFSGALAGLEMYSTLAKAGVVSGLVYVALCIGLAYRFGLTGAVAGIAASALIQSAVLGLALVRGAARRNVPIAWRGSWQERAILWSFALPASLTGLLSLPAVWLANAVLALQAGGYQQLALFGAANTFRTMVLFVPQAINNVGMSLLNNQQRTSSEAYKRVFWMNAALTALSAVVTAAALFLAGAPLLRLFGPEFGAGRQALGILLGAAVIEAVAIAAYQIVVSRGRIWASLFFVSLPRDASLVLLAALLTPSFGAAGLAGAYAIGWTLALLGILALVSRLGISAAGPVAVPAR